MPFRPYTIDASINPRPRRFAPPKPMPYPMRGLAPLLFALRCARWGWPVLPLWPVRGGRCACGKANCQHPGKHPLGSLVPKGVLDATTDPNKISRWWYECPDATVAVALESAGLLLVDPDSGAAQSEAHDLGLQGAVVRRSRSDAYLFLRPDGCPIASIINSGTSGELDVQTNGYVVVYGWHVCGCAVYLDPLDAPPLVPAPDRAVQMLSDAQQRNGTVAELTPGADEPPVRLDVCGLDLWHGRLAVRRGGGLGPTDGPGTADRSETLYALGAALARAGASSAGIVAALAERDQALGYEKYAERRDGGEREYARIAAKVLAEGSRPSAPRADAEGPPPFPLEALPPSIRALAEEGARSIVAPPEFIAVPLLVLAGATVGNAVELELKPGWREGSNLYAAVVAEPGSKKSPALNLAGRPIHRVQGRLAQDWKRQMAEYREDLARWEGQNKAQRGPKPDEPPFYSVLTTDSTSEALAAMLAANKGLALIRDELVGWVRAMDQYRNGRGADRQHFLSFWSREPVKVDRKGAPPIFVPRPCLSVVGGVQPDLLPDLGDTAQREDGFLDRLLWSFPDPVPDHWSSDEVSEETVQAVEVIFERLYTLEDTTDDNGDAQPLVVRLSRAAQSVWEAWYQAHVAEMASDSFSTRLRGPWAKFPAQLARLALILHMLEAPEVSEVGVGTLTSAITLVAYFKAHAARVYRHLHAERRGLNIRILQALKQQGRVSQSDLLHGVFKRNLPARRLRDELEALAGDGLIVQEVEQTGGRPATYWRLA
ncbi:MAG: DUF3987 domain-containing protein [Chloroflexi bacterium]|nr:DUF3987 domain-containing protein [Chloroflexota bacterium]